MSKFTLTAISAAFLLAMSAGALAATMSKAEYKSAKAAVVTKYDADAAACKTLAGNAKDICMEEAKGGEKVAMAELSAKNNPGYQRRYDVRIAKADAAYAVAKEKCDDLNGNAKDVCRKEATSAYVAAKADAKVAAKTADANTTAHDKTVNANAAAQDKKATATQDAAAAKSDAAYAVAKEKCDALAGDAKANCIKDAKALYGKS